MDAREYGGEDDQGEVHRAASGAVGGTPEEHDADEEAFRGLLANQMGGQWRVGVGGKSERRPEEDENAETDRQRPETAVDHSRDDSHPPPSAWSGRIGERPLDVLGVELDRLPVGTDASRPRKSWTQAASYWRSESSGDVAARLAARAQASSCLPARRRDRTRSAADMDPTIPPFTGGREGLRPLQPRSGDVSRGRCSPGNL